MKSFNRERIISIGHAMDGIIHVVRSQANTWIYIFITVAVLILSFLLRLSTLEWVIILLLIGLVWSAECFNTALESIVDLVSPEIHPLAKIAKDTAAAGTLILAISAALIGAIIFGVHILKGLSI